MSECHYTSLYVTITMKIWRKKYLNKNKSWFNTTPKIIHGSKTVCFGKVNICLAVCFEFEIWCLTSLSAIFQKPEYPERTTWALENMFEDT